MKFIDLKSIRKLYDINQRFIVLKTGMSQATISQLETWRQQLHEEHTESLKKAFPELDIESYIFESDRYPCYRDNEFKYKRQFPGDRSKPNAIRMIEGQPILVEEERVHVSFSGHIFLDRYAEGISSAGYYHIKPHEFTNPDLYLSIKGKRWCSTTMFEELKRLYQVACALTKVGPVTQN